MTKDIKRKQVKCYVCRGKDYPENLIKEEKKYGKKVAYKYFHESCKKTRSVARDNKSNMFNWESNDHRTSKIHLFKLISEGNVELIDQFNQIINLTYDFIGVESPVAIGKGIEIPYINPRNCKTCIDKYKLNNDFNINKIDDFNKELHIEEIRSCKDKDYFQIHPCVYCPFNNLKYKCVFDIGLGMNGEYTVGVEILNKSKITKSKLLYCIKNKIELFEVLATDVKDYKDSGKIQCERVWWRDNNGNIELSNTYGKLLEEGEMNEINA